MHQDVERTLLEELKARLEQLPRFELRFGGAPVEGLPDALVRYKVLAVVNEFIKRAKQ
jgi:hypothetical protein